eukprot:bmy_20521T0
MVLLGRPLKQKIETSGHKPVCFQRRLEQRVMLNASSYEWQGQQADSEVDHGAGARELERKERRKGCVSRGKGASMTWALLTLWVGCLFRVVSPPSPEHIY